MKQILVPTEFNELSDHALEVAKIITSKTKGTINTLHVVQGPQSSVYCSTGELIQDPGIDYSDWNEKFEQGKEKMALWSEDHKTPTKSKVILGKIDQAIAQEVKEKNIELVILGTKGYDKGAFWEADSHTKYLINHLPTPILSLKCDRKNLSLDKIVFVSDFLDQKPINLQALKQLQDVFDAELVLLKINKEEVAEDSIKSQIESFAKANQLDNYRVELKRNESIELGIQEYCLENDIDLVALGTHQRSGLSKLFKKSISDDLVKNLFQPILTFPI